MNNATILVKFNEANTNSVPVSLAITVTDSSAEKKTMTYTDSNVVANETQVKATMDLSTLSDGNLTITASVKDDQGNVDNTTSPFTVTKKADAPIVKYTSVKRTAEGKAEIDIIRDSNVKYYYMIADEEPTVDAIVANDKELKVDKQVEITNGESTKSYVAYIVGKTETGTLSTSPVAVKIAKLTAQSIKSVTNLHLKTGTQATYEWEYDENEEGFVEYKAVLELNSTAVAEQTIAKGTKEVNFFDDMKKAAGQYKIKVVAVADNVDYTNSTEITISPTQVQEVATSVSATFDSTNKTLLKFNITGEVANIEDYTIKIAKYDASLSDKYEVIETVSTNKTFYDISDIMSDKENGTYKFEVIANAKADVLKVNKSSLTSVQKIKDSTIKYNQVVVPTDLSVAEVSATKVTLTGTLLNQSVYEDLSSISYKLWRKEAGDAYYASESISKLPHEVVASLESSTTYCFILETTVNDVKYPSNEVTATTKAAPIETTSAIQYVAYEAQSEIEPMAKITGDGITYNDGTLYIGKSGTVTKYSSEDEGVADIIEVLSQMAVGDKMKINNNKITELELTSSSTNAKTYDLSKVDETADVTVTGNESYLTSVKGKVAKITLKGTNAKFDLVDLTATNGVVANATGYEVSVAKDTKITPNSSTSNVITVNGVKFTGKLDDLWVRDEGFDFVGQTSETLAVDTSNVEKAITLNIQSSSQNQLDLIANEDYATKVTTNTIKNGTLNIKSGKVDLSDAQTSFTTIKAGDTNASNVIIVTDKKATNGDMELSVNVPTTETALITGSSFKFKVDADGDAKYIIGENSNEVILSIQAAKTVTITK